MTAHLPPAKKSLGQCFLVEKGYALDIVTAIRLVEGETVLEIGPGRGILTSELVRTPAKIVAVEIDGRLLETLREQFCERRDFTLWHEDFLETDFEKVLSPDSDNKVTGNLPYHLVSEVLFKLFKYIRMARHNPDLPWISAAVLMMQKEVAERVVAKQGKKAYGLPSIFAQIEAEAQLLFSVPKEAFRPEPKVDGAIVRLDFYRIPPAYPVNFQVFERIIRFCFHQRRKMLKSTLAQLSGVHPHWQASDLDFTRRPETLSPAEWVSLSDCIASKQQANED